MNDLFDAHDLSPDDIEAVQHMSNGDDELAEFRRVVRKKAGLPEIGHTESSLPEDAEKGECD